MDEKTTKRIIEYYNMGYTHLEISLKDDIFYSDKRISEIMQDHKDKITFLTTKDIMQALNISSVVARNLIKRNIKTIRNASKFNKRTNYRINKKDFIYFLNTSDRWLLYNYNKEIINNYINLDKRLKININIRKFDSYYNRRDIQNILKISDGYMQTKDMFKLGVKLKPNKDCKFLYGNNAYKEKYLSKNEVEQFIKIGRYKHRNEALTNWLKHN